MSNRTYINKGVKCLIDSLTNGQTHQRPARTNWSYNLQILDKGQHWDVIARLRLGFLKIRTKIVRKSFRKDNEKIPIRNERKVLKWANYGMA